MVLKKVMKLNTSGSIGLCFPVAMMRKLDVVPGDYVNLSVVGNTIHVTKVKLD